VEIAAAKRQTTIETIERRPLAPDLFEIPAGYQEDSKLTPP